MISITRKQDCCGCMACAQKCPAHCIRMETDAEGFWYPHVDPQRCLQCGACAQVCPLLALQPSADSVPSAYAAKSCQDELRVRSSSGGAFGTLAQEILDKGGIVYGAAFDGEFSLRHIEIQKKADLPLLWGSKYLQSRTDDAYGQVKAHLDGGKTVLFSGTACQIAGLNGFLGRAYPNLITVDVLCHGVPSPGVWKRYLSYRAAEAGSEPVSVNFRSKHDGWRNFSLEIQFSNGTVFRQSMREELYMQLFLENLTLRPSCHQCAFKTWKRPSDLTIGDFWGVENFLPKMDDDQGVSLIFVHTEKGQALLDAVQYELLLTPVDGDAALPRDADSRRSVRPHPRRKAFFQAYAKGVPVDQWELFLRPSIPHRIKCAAKRLLHRE